MENQKSELEAYKIVNEKINKEVDEYYQINNLFLLVQTIGVFGLFSILDKKLSVVPLVVMLASSFFWSKINEKAYSWREYWVRRAKKFEREGVLNGISLWVETEEVQFMGGVWRLISYLPFIFFVTWSIFTVIYFINLLSLRT